MNDRTTSIAHKYRPIAIPTLTGEYRKIPDTQYRYRPNPNIYINCEHKQWHKHRTFERQVEAVVMISSAICSADINHSISKYSAFNIQQLLKIHIPNVYAAMSKGHTKWQCEGTRQTGFIQLKGYMQETDNFHF